MAEPRYSPSAVRTLAAAIGRPADVHDWAITDCSTGRVTGIYASEALAFAAIQRLMQPGGLYVITVLHPANCTCPEAARLGTDTT